MSNGSMKEQLGRLMVKTGVDEEETSNMTNGKFTLSNMPKKKSSPPSVPANPKMWVGDGVDHINISRRGLTELGQALDPATFLPFTHNVFGYFSSVSAFWDFIETGCKEERLRDPKFHVRQKLKGQLERILVPNIEFLILDAMYQRIAANPPLVEAIKQSTLPFDCYVVEQETNKRFRKSVVSWIYEGMEVIRTAIKNDTQPNFVKWNNRKKKSQIMEEFLELTGWKPKVAKSLEENSLLRTILEQKQHAGEYSKTNVQRRHPVKTLQRDHNPEAVLQTDVNLELDPRDPSPQRTIEKVVDLTSQTRTQFFPTMFYKDQTNELQFPEAVLQTDAKQEVDEETFNQEVKRPETEVEAETTLTEATTVETVTVEVTSETTEETKVSESLVVVPTSSEETN